MTSFFLLVVTLSLVDLLIGRACFTYLSDRSASYLGDCQPKLFFEDIDTATHKSNVQCLDLF